MNRQTTLRPGVLAVLAICIPPVGFARLHAMAQEQNSPPPAKETTITIVYDNNAEVAGLETDWGFGCLIQGPEKTILFDTGGRGDILLDNMRKLKLDPKDVDVVVLSHIHGDHTGGLKAFLEQQPGVPVYIPRGFPQQFKGEYKPPLAELIECPDSREICPGVRTTGTLDAWQLTEHGLCVNTPDGWVVITGCAHPGADQIAAAASKTIEAQPYLVVGGYHLPPESQVESQNRTARKKIASVIARLDRLGVKRVAPCHCSGDLARRMCKEHFGDRCELIGVGHVFEFAARQGDSQTPAAPH